MIVRLVIGSLLAAVAMMAWGFVFWAFSPFPYLMMRKLPKNSEDKIVALLKHPAIESGHYFYPFPDEDAMSGQDEAAMEVLNRQHREGPLMQIIVVKEGQDHMSPKVYGFGFGHFFATAFLAGCLLLFALPNLQTYLARVFYVFFIGVFATGFIIFGQVIWFHQPILFPLIYGGFQLICVLLAGLILAAFLRPKPA